jgi:hypothetical protein
MKIFKETKKMVKTLIYKTLKDYSLIKYHLQKIIDEHDSSPFKESGSIVLIDEPKLHLFTASFKEDDFRFKVTINSFNKLDNIKVTNCRIKESAETYGDIVIYLTLSKEQKNIVDDLVITGLKKNTLAITIGTIKENFNLSIDKREEGLKLLIKKIYLFFKGTTLSFKSAQSITF